MSSEWIGSLVSLDCGDHLGTYQGQVKLVDHSTQTLTICRAFRNGIVCEVPEITINACDIKNLKILKAAVEADSVVRKHSTPSKLSKDLDCVDCNGSPVKVVEVQRNCEDSHRNVNGHNNGANECSSNAQNYIQTRDGRSEEMGGYVRNGSSRYSPTKDVHKSGAGAGPRYTPTKDDQYRTRRNSASESRNLRQSTTPRKIDFRRKAAPREDCFSAPAESLLDDFDFEKNLALFDKKAVFEEIENGQPQIIKPVEKKPTKYRCDENVLQSGPVTLQQIHAPNPAGLDYVTDSGLVIPSISYELRSRLFDVAEKYGFSEERRVEMVGRSSSEMVLQLLGGSNRLNPRNGHQLPTVVVLCGPHIQGAYGLSCARHIANHGVKTLLFLPNFVRMAECVEREIKLYELSAGHKYTSAADSPSQPVDMIINCLDSHEIPHLREQNWYKSHVQWANQNRAPVLNIDPPVDMDTVEAKWSLGLMLPLKLKSSSSQVYLCDLGFPLKVFTDVAIKYLSPFSHKFIIPLHVKS